MTLTMLSLRCPAALTTTMARPVATGPPVRLSPDGWYFPQEEKLQVQLQGPARQHVGKHTSASDSIGSTAARVTRGKKK